MSTIKNMSDHDPAIQARLAAGPIPTPELFLNPDPGGYVRGFEPSSVIADCFWDEKNSAPNAPPGIALPYFALENRILTAYIEDLLTAKQFDLAVHIAWVPNDETAQSGIYARLEQVLRHVVTDHREHFDRVAHTMGKLALDRQNPWFPKTIGSQIVDHYGRLGRSADADRYARTYCHAESAEKLLASDQEYP